MLLTSASGRSRQGPSCGQPGGKTSVIGYGLSNFCANGGYGGCACCYMCCCSWAALCNVCCNGPCALYYGASGGAYGNPGAGQMWCQGNHCWNKQLIPYLVVSLTAKVDGCLVFSECQGCGYYLNMYATTQLGWGGGGGENYEKTMFLALAALLLGYMAAVAAVVNTVTRYGSHQLQANRRGILIP